MRNNLKRTYSSLLDRLAPFRQLQRGHQSPVELICRAASHCAVQEDDQRLRNLALIVNSFLP